MISSYHASFPFIQEWYIDYRYTLHSSTDQPQIRNPILLVLQVNNMCLPRNEMLAVTCYWPGRFPFLKQQFPGVEFRGKLNTAHWLLLSQVKIFPSSLLSVLSKNKTNPDFPLLFLLTYTLSQNFDTDKRVLRELENSQREVLLN